MDNGTVTLAPPPYIIKFSSGFDNAIMH